MKTFITRAALITGLCILPAHLFGQEDHRFAPAVPPVAPVPKIDSFEIFGEQDSQPMPAMEQLWQQAKSDDDREQVREMIAEVISEEFDNDLKRRKADLQKIVDRVERLKEQLERRIRNKDEIVDLQIKQTTMSWDGLGWNGDTEGRARGMAASTLYSLARQGRGMGGFWEGRPAAGGPLVEMVQKSALGDQKRLVFLTKKLAESLAEQSAQSANGALWQLYESTKHKVDERAYWSTLIEAGEAAVERADSNMVKSNTLDTVAHMYEQLEDRAKAIELQQRAAELQPGSDNVRAFLRQLTPKSDDDAEGDEPAARGLR